MLKLFIHAENFTLFHEKQTWEIGRLNFLVGELATGKSSLIKLLELFPLNDQEMKEVKRFTSFSPYANFKNLVNDLNKPLKIAFEMHSAIGIYHQTYEFKPAQNEREAVLANFQIIFNEELVFDYTNGDGQLFTQPTLNLFETARNFLLAQAREQPLTPHCVTRSELLGAVFRLADESTFIGEVEKEFLQRTPALKMRKKEPRKEGEPPFADFFFQLFEISDFNGLDEFAESLSWYIRQSFSTMGMFFQRTLLNTSQNHNPFHPIAFKKIEDGYRNLVEFEKYFDLKKTSKILKDFGLPQLIQADINDGEGNNYGYTFLFEYANKKRVQYFQLSATEQKKIHLLTQIISHDQMQFEMDFHNDYGWISIDNLENIIPTQDQASFIKKLLKHFPKYYYFLEIRGAQIESLSHELILSKKIKKSEIKIYHFIKNKMNLTSRVSKHVITSKNNVFPPLLKNTTSPTNWKKNIARQLHFN